LWCVGVGLLRVHIEPDRYKTAVGGDVTFRCVVNGNGRAAAQVRWMRADGRALPGHAVARTDRLTMRRVDSTDEGRYICIVRTHRGRGQAEAELIVSGGTSHAFLPFLLHTIKTVTMKTNGKSLPID